MKYNRDEKVISSKIEEDLFLLSMEKGAYFRMNPIGTRIWELLETPKTQSQLVSDLLKEFEVDEATCEKEVEAFLEKTAQMGLLKKESDA